ncbi:XkdF-like putative serine protease domain-containing protein [Pedobacter steynii]
MKKLELSELAVYNLEISPEQDALVDAVALVAEPAHESMYLAFNKDEEFKLKFSTDDTKQSVIGAAIIPDKLILRNPNSLVKDYHFVKFSSDAIEIMAKEFFRHSFHSNINIGHTDEQVQAYFYQSIIVGDEIGQGKVNGLDVPNGTWVLGAYIEDKEVYNKVKELGFSVEGLFKYSQYKNDFESQLNTELKKLKNNLKKFK